MLWPASDHLEVDTVGDGKALHPSITNGFGNGTHGREGIRRSFLVPARTQRLTHPTNC